MSAKQKTSEKKAEDYGKLQVISVKVSGGLDSKSFLRENGFSEIDIHKSGQRTSDQQTVEMKAPLEHPVLIKFLPKGKSALTPFELARKFPDAEKLLETGRVRITCTGDVSKGTFAVIAQGDDVISDWEMIVGPVTALAVVEAEPNKKEVKENSGRVAKEKVAMADVVKTDIVALAAGLNWGDAFAKPPVVTTKKAAPPKAPVPQTVSAVSVPRPTPIVTPHVLPPVSKQPAPIRFVIPPTVQHPRRKNSRGHDHKTRRVLTVLQAVDYFTGQLTHLQVGDIALYVKATGHEGHRALLEDFGRLESIIRKLKTELDCIPHPSDP